MAMEEPRATKEELEQFRHAVAELASQAQPLSTEINEARGGREVLKAADKVAQFLRDIDAFRKGASDGGPTNAGKIFGTHPWGFTSFADDVEAAARQLHRARHEEHTEVVIKERLQMAVALADHGLDTMLHFIDAQANELDSASGP